jgi:hypothetical protein
MVDRDVLLKDLDELGNPLVRVDMSASVHTTISPLARWVPMRRTVPDPLLRWKCTTSICGKRGAASYSLASVPSVDESSTHISSYE